MNISKILEAVNEKLEKLESDLMFARMRNERLEDENRNLIELNKKLEEENEHLKGGNSND